MKKKFIGTFFSFFFLWTSACAQKSDQNDVLSEKISVAQRNVKDDIEIILEIDKKNVQLGEIFVAKVVVRYHKDLKIQLPGPFFDFAPFYKKSYEIMPIRQENDTIIYEIQYKLSKLSLESTELPEIFVKYEKKEENLESLGEKISIFGPKITIKRIIDDAEINESTIGDMTSPFIIKKHLTKKDYFMGAGLLTLCFVASFICFFIYKNQRNKKKIPIFLIRKDLILWEKKIYDNPKTSREELRIFYWNVSLLTKKILAILWHNENILGMSKKEIINIIQNLPGQKNNKKDHEQQTKKIIDFFEKGEKIKYSIEEIDLDENLKKIRYFISFLQQFTKRQTKNLTSTK